MTRQECPEHRVAMEIVPADPRSRCPKCGYLTHHLQFEHCRECGQRMVIEEPEPHWRCPLCAPAGRKATPSASVFGAPTDRTGVAVGSDAQDAAIPARW